MAASPAWWPDFLLLAAIWGSSFLFMRLAAVQLGALPTAWLRAVVGALTLLPLLWWRGGMRALQARWKPIFFAGVLNTIVPSAGLSFALLSLSTGLAAIVNATGPLFGSLIAWAWLRQRPGGMASLGLAIGFAGVAALAWDKAGLKSGAEGWGAMLAVLAATAAAASGALSALFTRKYLDGVPALVLASGSQVGAVLGLAVPALLVWPAAWPSALAWIGILGAGALCTGLGYLLFFRLIEKAGPTRAITVTFVMPLFAMFYGLLFLGEPITGGMVACAAVVIGGTSLATGIFTRRPG